MNKKITLYLLSASLVTLSEGYALFGFGGKSKKDDPKSKVAKMVKEGFPSATFGSCTKTDGGVKFDVAIRHYKNSQNDQKLLKAYDTEVNKKLDKLKQCAKKKNPNFTKALAASCTTHKNIIPKEWTRSKALCEMVSGKQGAVEAKNEAITLMKQDYGSSKFACSKDYGKINWSGATDKFKTLSSDSSKEKTFAEYRKITDNHLKALSKCAIEKNKNFAAVLHKSCTTDAPLKQWTAAVKLCEKAAKIMDNKSAAADAKVQANVDDKLFPGTLSKIGCTKGAAAPFDPAGLADYMKRQADILNKKGVSEKEKLQAVKNGKRAHAYVARLSKCAVKEGDVNFNKILAEKFDDIGENCSTSTEIKTYAKNPKVKGFISTLYGKDGLCKKVNKTSINIENAKIIAEAKKELGVPSGRLGWVGFPTGVVSKLGNPDNFEHLTNWFKLDKAGFDKHFGIILRGITVGKNGKVANINSVQSLADGCSEGTLAEFAKKNKMESVTAVCDVASKSNSVDASFKTLKLPSGLMAPAAYKICNEVMTEVWQEEDGIEAIKTILAHTDALPRWQKHVAGIHGCISKNDTKTGVTKNPIMTSYIVAAGDELKKLRNANLDTLVDDARTIQNRREKYLENEAGVSDKEVNVDEDDVANMDNVAEAPESYDGKEEEAAPAEEEEATDLETEEGGIFGAEDEEETPTEAADFGDANDLGEDDDFAAPAKPGRAIEAEEEEEVEWLD